MSNHKKLLEDIPNQIKNCFGIIADVGERNIDGKTVVDIKVKVSRSPISYHGKFYKRSGSTTQELNGPELQSFLLQKGDLRWEEVVSI